MTTILDVNNLVKNYGDDQLAVNGISLQVEEGETFGFLGPNGAGKSTTINMLTTLLKISGGSAKIADIDVAKKPDKVREIIGLVPQDLTVDEDLTGRENMQLQADLYEVPYNQAVVTITDLLKTVGLENVADRMVKTYSGGMKKRLELAEGLIRNPKVLFLDEPTLGLDVKTRNAIWEYIRQLKVRNKLTVFMTTHYLDEADEQCDRVAIINHGKIVAIGTPLALKNALGGDVITISSEVTGDLTEMICKVEGVLEVKRDANQYRIKATRGELAIPRILTHLASAGITVTSISLARPSLDQVFLEYTGRLFDDVGSKAVIDIDVQDIKGRA